MSKAIAVFASARRNGNTGKFIDFIAHKLDMKVIDLSEKDISPYDYEHKNRHDDFITVMNELLNYENILFVTPVYWYGPSAQMKVFIDRTSDFLDLEELKHIGRGLRNKTAYIVCTSVSNEADSSFIKSLKDTFEYLGMHCGGHIHANCKNGYIQNDYQEDVHRFVESVRLDKG